MESAYKVADDLYALPSYLEVPMLGLVPINAFLLKSRQPVLVDTGLAADSTAFCDALRNVIDPKDLKWIWLTHPDPDHIGSLHTLLKEAPQAKVITTFLGFGIMGLINPLPMDRVYFLYPGQHIDLGDRTLTAVAPPTFDSPAPRDAMTHGRAPSSAPITSAPFCRREPKTPRRSPPKTYARVSCCGNP